jgi:hypothetical protein
VEAVVVIACHPFGAGRTIEWGWIVQKKSQSRIIRSNMLNTSRVIPENANAVKKGKYLISVRNVTRPMMGITRTGMNNKAGHVSLHEVIKSLFRMQLSEACLSPAV